jgi:hypothetical protein
MFQGERMYVNVDAKWGDFRVGLVEADTRGPAEPAAYRGGPDTLGAIPGYALKRTVMVSEDHVKVKLRW